MNDTMAHHGLDLVRYVDEVRRELADLPDEVRTELTEGLSADLAELVEERGSSALPRPEEYAAELRASAGLPLATRRPLLAPDWWRPAWEVVVAARPVWWVARAWAWVMLLHLLLWDSGADGYDVPWLPTHSFGLGLALWALVSVVSIQVGRGKLWPGASPRNAVAIAALAVLNVGSLAAAVLAIEQVDTVADTRSMVERDEADDVVRRTAITYQDRQSCSLLVFDADGKRLRGVTIEDQAGRVLPQRNRNC